MAQSSSHTIMSINSVCFVIIIALEMVVFWWFPAAVWEHLLSHGLICTELNHTLNKLALWYKYAILSDFLMMTGAAYDNRQAQVFTNSDAANSQKATIKLLWTHVGVLRVVVYKPLTFFTDRDMFSRILSLTLSWSMAAGSAPVLSRGCQLMRAEGVC